MAGEPPLQDLTVLSFESRRAAEIGALVQRYGGTIITAPSLREIPIGTNPESEEFLRRLEQGSVDIVILLTGVGTQALATALAPLCPPSRFAALLGGTALVARGPKPVAALRQLGLSPAVVVPEPNTWREILAALDAHVPLAGRRVAVQEYGRSNDELLEGLRARGAEVLPVPVYRWAYPEDREPLRAGVRRLADGAVDIALFTSAQQVEHVVETAVELQRLDALRAAIGRVVVASVGPVCSAALRAHGLPIDLEPEHPKMGHLVNAVAARARALLARKRG
jgi:uroporphyrinogen-III synthase